ncbi:hypothetical protein ECC02_002394 [Trypanosoma cruzi]|uniref:Uncharacterized protein n=1 Tax=Trypanosoma cruzi TaxID=5693 RepID=A0A7J6YCJ8_TRYCR|nr:hypothetical protein ECC02_002394 [Trypanosoma cruzi]
MSHAHTGPPLPSCMTPSNATGAPRDVAAMQPEKLKGSERTAVMGSSSSSSSGKDAPSPIEVKRCSRHTLRGLNEKHSPLHRSAAPCRMEEVRKLCRSLGTEKAMMVLLREVRLQRMSTSHYRYKYRRALRALRSARQAALRGSDKGETPHGRNENSQTLSREGGKNDEKGKVFSQERDRLFTNARGGIISGVDLTTTYETDSARVLEVLNDPAASTDRLREALRDLCRRYQHLCRARKEQREQSHHFRLFRIASYPCGGLDACHYEDHVPVAFAHLSVLSETSSPQLPHRRHSLPSFAEMAPTWKEQKETNDFGVQAMSTISSLSDHPQRSCNASVVAVAMSSSPSPHMATRRIDGNSFDRYAGARYDGDDVNSSSRSTSSRSTASIDSTSSALHSLTQNEKLRQWRLDALRLQGRLLRGWESER